MLVAGSEGFYRFVSSPTAQAQLGWRAEVSFEEGVGVMLAHIEDWRTAPLWNRESIAEATRDWFACLGDK